ncbi:ABC transporter ATP-binding protein [Xanthomonas melonis]|uniref:ABC transporter ATP-binding protein n=1 Tax=Xanthomonas melonis TaxID=56456 RepID=UPI001E4EBA84|nr:ABC transporter ATP-binding protein [Xanthomonas melonis]MCD0279222.1 ABC transporter ATP-binding protein [Xanthomonas melonis]
MSSDMSVIEVDNLSKSYFIYDTPRDRLKQFLLPRFRRLFGLSVRSYYTDFHALDSVSFKVGRGETVGIIGRNGCGKSTLLQMVCGTLSPTQGKIVTRGRIAALLELGSGFNPEFTGRENVYLNAAILGLSPKEIDARYSDIEKFADIGRFIDQPIKTYSSGMVVRLAFATAIHVDPDILVVDEALSVGDTAFQQKCLNRIRSMQREGVSILLVTHSANALIEYCDRGIYLRRGKMVMDGACRDVVKVYADDVVAEEGGITFDLPADAGASPEGQFEHDPSSRVVKEGPSRISIQSVTLCDEQGATVAAVNQNDWVQVKVKVRVDEQVEMPCFGVQITSTDGIALWSATTQSMNLPVQAMRPGIYEINWALKANFSGNRYILAIGVGLIENGEYRRTHRLPYAGHFDVVSEPMGGAGWLAPQPRVQVATL